jgi:RecA-family ATPase
MKIRNKDYTGKNFKDLNNSEKKEVLDYVTCNGLLYFKSILLLIPTGRGEDSYAYHYEYKNVCNPLRDDRHPSLSIFHIKENNTFRFHDHGSSEYRGDYIKFAAMRHGLRNNEDFSLILDKIAKDIGLDKADWSVFDKILNYEHIPGESLDTGFRIPILTDPTQIVPIKYSNNNLQKNNSQSEKDLKCKEDYFVNIELFKIEEQDLENNHLQFLQETGITYSAMRRNGAFIIRGYSISCRCTSAVIKNVPKGKIWICYFFGQYGKIYCPSPKMMWFIGKKPKHVKYLFGTDASREYLFSAKKKGSDKPLIIAAGEKDVLSLLSRGYHAICFNSESTTISKDDLKAAVFDLEHLMNIIVLYDTDITGKKRAKEINEQLDLEYITLPDWLLEKSGKDVTDFFRLGGTTEELDKLIEDAVSRTIKKKKIESEENITPVEIIEESTHFKSLPQPIIPFSGNEKLDHEIVSEKKTINVLPTSKEIVNQENKNVSVIEVDVDQEMKRLSIRTAMQRLKDAKSLPDILPLADVLFQRGELSIFFGDTGLGKSIFAVALADAINKGVSFLQLENKCEPLSVQYYDFELSDKQFEKRYADDNGNPYPFNNNLFIDNIDLSSIDWTDKKIVFEEVLIKKIKSDLKETGAKVLIIDNISFLSTYTAEDTQVALRLMKLLKDLKNEFDISILVLAHTVKKFGIGGASLQDLAGSKQISNFADSVFTIAASKKDPNLRYIKPVKHSRSAEIKFDANNVIICEIQKEDSFLTFIHKGYGKEIEHLVSLHEDKEEEAIERAKELQEQGKTIREIASEIGYSKSTVGRWLKPES